MIGAVRPSVSSVVSPATRTTLHRVAAHILGRRRFDVTGRFGLRATPGGFGTPAFGDGPEVVRVAGTTLVREMGGEARRMAMHGSTLRRLAAFAGTDIQAEFSAGAETPPLGDPDEVLAMDAVEVQALADWYWLGWMALDIFLDGLPEGAVPATTQLWPEHFDAGTNVGLPDGTRLSAGFSPGDSFEERPYVYVGPRNTNPAAADFWNAPFGAVWRADDVLSRPNPVDACVQFFMTGLRYAGSS